MREEWEQMLINQQPIHAGKRVKQKTHPCHTAQSFFKTGITNNGLFGKVYTF